MKYNPFSPLVILLFSAILFCTSANAIDTMPTHLEDLEKLSDEDLNELYDYGTAYFIPGSLNPETEWLLTGIPLPVPGYKGPSALLNFFWGGKIFTTDFLGKTTLSNQVLPTTPFTFNNVTADVKIKDNSLTNDGEPVIYLNYKDSNITIAKQVRDEIRLISPNLYLGRAYLKNDFLTRMITRQKYSFVLWFALEDLN